MAVLTFACVEGGPDDRADEAGDASETGAGSDSTTSGSSSESSSEVESSEDDEGDGTSTSTGESESTSAEESTSTEESTDTEESTETDASTESDTDTGFVPCPSDAACPDDELCLDGVCSDPDASALPSCPRTPSFVELPLPPALSALPDPPLSLAFVDVDGDGDDELTVLDDQGLHVVEGAQLLDSPVPEPGVFDDFAALDIDLSPGIDLALTSSVETVLGIAQGDGAGGFVVVDTFDVPGNLIAPMPVDADLDGELELAACFDPDALDIVVFGSLILGLGDWQLLQVPNGHQDIARADVDGDGDLDLLVVDGSTAHKVRANPEGEWSSGGQIWGLAPGWASASWIVGDLDGDGTEAALAVAPTLKGVSVIERWTGVYYEPDSLQFATVPGAREVGVFLDLGPGFGPGEVLVLADGEGAVGVRAQGQPLGCADPLLGIPGATAVIAGDVDGDGVEELALIDADGVVRAFGLE